MESLFREQKEFKIQRKEKKWLLGNRSKFYISKFPIGIFDSLFPATDQNSYRYMLVKHRILQLLGVRF